MARRRCSSGCWLSAQISALPANPDVRFGMVTHHDHGDEYVTRSVDFTDDVGAFQSVLQNVQAASDGDEPEALSEGLDVLVVRLVEEEIAQLFGEQ